MSRLNGAAKWTGIAFLVGGLIWTAGSRIAIIETRLNSIEDRLKRIESKVDSLGGNRRIDRPLQKRLDIRPKLPYLRG